MSLSNIRTQLASALGSIPTLRVYDNWPAVFSGEFPCAVIHPRSGNWNTTLPRRTPQINWEILILLGKQGDISQCQDTLDALIADTGSTSAIKPAIELYTYTPSTACSFARITGFRDYVAVSVNDNDYLSIKFDVFTQ